MILIGSKGRGDKKNSVTENNMNYHMNYENNANNIYNQADCMVSV